MKSTKALGVAGIIIGVAFWYIVAGLSGIFVSPLLGNIFGIGSVVIEGWLLLGSLLIFICTGIYIADYNRAETKSVLKWLISGVVLWGVGHNTFGYNAVYKKAYSQPR